MCENKPKEGQWLSGEQGAEMTEGDQSAEMTDDSDSGSRTFRLSELKYGLWNALAISLLRKKGADEEFVTKIQDRLTEGWGVNPTESIEPDRVVLSKKGKQSLLGHVLIAMLTVWWTVGLGNLAYFYFRKYGRGDKRVVRALEVMSSSDHTTTDTDTTDGGETSDDPLDRIQRLRELADQGAITEAEFYEQKAELLDQL